MWVFGLGIRVVSEDVRKVVRNSVKELCVVVWMVLCRFFIGCVWRVRMRVVMYSMVMVRMVNSC